MIIVAYLFTIASLLWRPLQSLKSPLSNQVKQALLGDSIDSRKLVRAMGLSAKCRVSTQHYSLFSAHHQGQTFIGNHFVAVRCQTCHDVIVYLFTMSPPLSGPQAYRQTPSRRQSQTGSGRRFTELKKVG